MPAEGHAIPFIALQDGKFNVTEEAAAFLQSVSQSVAMYPWQLACVVCVILRVAVV